MPSYIGFPVNMSANTSLHQCLCYKINRYRLFSNTALASSPGGRLQANADSKTSHSEKIIRLTSSSVQPSTEATITQRLSSGNFASASCEKLLATINMVTRQREATKSRARCKGIILHRSYSCGEHESSLSTRWCVWG